MKLLHKWLRIMFQVQSSFTSQNVFPDRRKLNSQLHRFYASIERDFPT